MQKIMSQILKDAESLHTDQHDANVISPVFSSIDQAGQKMIKLLSQQVSKINDTCQGKEKEISLQQAQR